MITIEQYDAAETTAIAASPALHEDNKWGCEPISLEVHGHVPRIQELKELQPLLNRFQQDRYPCYIYELGGLSQFDLDQFVWAKNALIDIQQEYYPDINSTIPVDGMLSALCIYRKIKTARPNVKTILEIGPGSGLNSLFFSRDAAIENYTQIEAKQITYLSQSMVNEKCYGPNVWEAVNSPSPILGKIGTLWHIPWWRVSDLYSFSIVYDVITANACLNEISDVMVKRYLELFNAKSHPETLLLIQCAGAPFYRDEQQLLSMLNEYGWFLNASVNGVDIENAVGGSRSRGDAVSTLWLTKNKDSQVSTAFSRLSDNSAVGAENWSRSALVEH